MLATADTTHSNPPRGLRWRSNTLFILTTVTIGLFTDLFLYGLVVPILPFILSDRISIPHPEIQSYASLLLACYAGASLLASMPAGFIADKLPVRQLPFLAGLLALTLATVLLFVGRSIGVLVLARILQGVSAAVVWTVGMALVMDTVGSGKMGVTMGTIFSVISVGELLSPLLGGIMYEKGGSNAVLALGLVVLAVDFIMRLLVIEKKVAARYGLVDPPSNQDSGDENGGAEEEADEESPLIGDKNDHHEDWTIPADHPKWAKTFPIVYCLRNPRLLCAQIVALTQAVLLGVFDSTVPTEAQDSFGFDSLRAGILFAPLVLPYLVLGPLAGKVVDVYGVKPSTVLGLAYQAIPLTLLRVPHPGGGAEIAKFCIFLTMSGVGMAIISSPSIVEASYVVERYHGANKDFFGEQSPYAQLFAINTMFFFLGLTIGPLVAGALRDSVGYGNMNAVMAAFCILVSILSFFYMGGRPRMFRQKA